MSWVSNDDRFNFSLDIRRNMSTYKAVLLRCYVVVEEEDNASRNYDSSIILFAMIELVLSYNFPNTWNGEGSKSIRYGQRTNPLHAKARILGLVS